MRTISSVLPFLSRFRIDPYQKTMVACNACQVLGVRSAHALERRVGSSSLGSFLGRRRPGPPAVALYVTRHQVSKEFMDRDEHQQVGGQT
jgi:hypothetical protein